MTRTLILRSFGTRAVSVGALIAVASATASATDVDAVITVDNAYGFGFGTANEMMTYFGGLRNVTSGEIKSGPPELFEQGDSNAGNGYTNPGVGPELYDIDNISTDDYMYMVAWSDESAFQGALASFTVVTPNGTQSVGTIDDPDVEWEVFATGMDRDSNIPGDTLTTADLGLINSQIGIANSNLGPAGTSVGWVDQDGMLPNGNMGSGELAFGDTNMGGSNEPNFPEVQGFDDSAQWMWYNEDPANITDPFSAGPEGPDGHNEFLIFRLPVSDIPTPGTTGLLLAGGVCVLRRRR